MSQDSFNREETLLDEVVRRYAITLYTFTEDEALAELWQQGYELTLQLDPRFRLAYDSDQKNPRHWRLAVHLLANDLLLQRLLADDWDGQDLEAELNRLQEATVSYYVFCPVDPRFCQEGGRWLLKVNMYYR